MKEPLNPSAADELPAVSRSGDTNYTEPQPFMSHDEILEAAQRMFEARKAFDGTGKDTSASSADIRRARKRSDSLTEYWHRSLDLTVEPLEFCKRCKEYDLGRTDREILAALILNEVSLTDDELRSCGDIACFIGVLNGSPLEFVRGLSEQGRLYKNGLISYEDEDEGIRNRKAIIDPTLFETILYGRSKSRIGWPVKSEAELYKHLAELTNAFARRSDAFGALKWSLPGGAGTLYRVTRKINLLLRKLKETLKIHPDWSINSFLRYGERTVEEQCIMLLVLLGKELGHLPAEHDLFTGSGLAQAASDCLVDVQKNMELLKPGNLLIDTDLIQPADGAGELLTGDSKELYEVEFELTPRSLRILGMEKKLAKKRNTDPRLREARICLDQLVLSDEVMRSLRLALTHARHHKRLMDEWGFAKTLPYGRGLTLLFTGPPGIGKTACAEAIASELSKPILLADYSRIQSCFVGGTEKNIVRTFRQARSNEAVLFWDEADAMFYDRDLASKSWEVRDVNVLLQELERYEGVCILATNRKIALDKALERRISLKIEFERPDRGSRLRIWEKLLPGKMPLAEDVDIEKLSETDLSGGEIKNVILNAARLALCQNGGGPVKMSDFEQAVSMETGGKWCKTKNQVGFGR